MSKFVEGDMVHDHNGNLVVMIGRLRDCTLTLKDPESGFIYHQHEDYCETVSAPIPLQTAVDDHERTIQSLQKRIDHLEKQSFYLTGRANENSDHLEQLSIHFNNLEGKVDNNYAEFLESQNPEEQPVYRAATKEERLARQGKDNKVVDIPYTPPQPVSFTEAEIRKMISVNYVYDSVTLGEYVDQVIFELKRGDYK